MSDIILQRFVLCYAALRFGQKNPENNSVYVDVCDSTDNILESSCVASKQKNHFLFLLFLYVAHLP